MNWGRHSILGVGIDAVDYAEVVEQVVACSKARRWLGVVALPVHGVMAAVLDAGFARDLTLTSMNVPDGQPVRWALRLLHAIRLTDRVYGPELMLQVCRRAETDRISIFLFGSRPEVLTRLRTSLSERFPSLKIAGSATGPEGPGAESPRPEDIEAIRSSGAHVTFVALGCPKQEHWVACTRDTLPMPVLAVGAAYDFIAGSVPQAPPILQRFGLEWAFRLAMEPRRLWKRYALLNPAYIALVAMQWLGIFRAE
jgi:N-acetylglucosaminyldiphosphoundecaprenol N-acetyl-beta-D-mannosaminyltransferase